MHNQRKPTFRQTGNFQKIFHLFFFPSLLCCTPSDHPSLLLFSFCSPSSPPPFVHRFANGTSQNCGNHMTGRSSTRIHAPPGGSSQAGSLIFGGGATQQDRFGGRGSNQRSNQRTQYQPQQQQQQQQQQSSFANKEQNNSFSNNQFQTSQQPKKQQQNIITGARSGTSSNVFASGTNQNCGNFMTDRPTSRVLAPPGGRSSGPLW